MTINNDGSMAGKTFSGGKYIGEHPIPKYGEETYANYNGRVKKAQATGFHLGDLSWNNYQIYCMGSGSYEGADSSAIIQ